MSVTHMIQNLSNPDVLKAVTIVVGSFLIMFLLGLIGMLGCLLAGNLSRAKNMRCCQQQVQFIELHRRMADLDFAMRGTSRELEAMIWEHAWLGGTVPPVVPAVFESFHNELQALMKGLGLIQQLVEAVPLDATTLHRIVSSYSGWLEDLGGRFRKFQLEDSARRQVLLDLEQLKERHRVMGETYCLSQIHPLWQSFPGMIHVLEVFASDEVYPVLPLSTFAAALDRHLDHLWMQFERGWL